MKIAIIEDDLFLRDELAILLIENNYEVLKVDLDNYLEDLTSFHPNLVLLDINLPNENGFEICKKIKKEHSIPIMFMTSSDREEDELKSIISGGDDFIRKPYNTLILLEKIKRTIVKADVTNYKEITIGEVTLDLHLSLIKFRDEEIELTRNEFKIMYFLFLNPNREITHDEIITYLWNDKFYVDENILNVNITRIRKKLESIGLYDFVKNIRRVGYRL